MYAKRDSESYRQTKEANGLYSIVGTVVSLEDIPVGGQLFRVQ